MSDLRSMREGVYTALVTPFTAEGTVDRQAWDRLLKRQVAAGVAGVVPAGCTGEAAVLTRDEREFLIRHAGQVVTRTMLLEGVWDYHFDPQTNVIDVHISRLRSKIDKNFDTPLLHTVRGSGYVIREQATG